MTNSTVLGHRFLAAMYQDDYFPDRLVDAGVRILERLCERVEQEQPADVEDLYRLTDDATEEFNALEEDFRAANSEIETVARDAIGQEFRFVADAYGFEDADGETLIGKRTW